MGELKTIIFFHLSISFAEWKRRKWSGDLCYFGINRKYPPVHFCGYFILLLDDHNVDKPFLLQHVFGLQVCS